MKLLMLPTRFFIRVRMMNITRTQLNDASDTKRKHNDISTAILFTYFLPV